MTNSKRYTGVLYRVQERKRDDRREWTLRERRKRKDFVMEREKSHVEFIGKGFLGRNGRDPTNRRRSTRISSYPTRGSDIDGELPNGWTKGVRGDLTSLMVTDFCTRTIELLPVPGPCYDLRYTMSYWSLLSLSLQLSLEEPGGKPL